MCKDSRRVGKLQSFLALPAAGLSALSFSFLNLKGYRLKCKAFTELALQIELSEVIPNANPSPDSSGNPFLRFFTEKKIAADSRK